MLRLAEVVAASFVSTSTKRVDLVKAMLFPFYHTKQILSQLRRALRLAGVAAASFASIVERVDLTFDFALEFP